VRILATHHLSRVYGLQPAHAAHCEHADFLKTETEIMYDGTGKITDLEVAIAGTKIGVSVTRAQSYPLGTPYTMDAATTLLTRKLNDIQASTAHVSAADKWAKQVLAILEKRDGRGFESLAADRLERRESRTSDEVNRIADQPMQLAVSFGPVAAQCLGSGHAHVFLGARDRPPGEGPNAGII